MHEHVSLSYYVEVGMYFLTEKVIVTQALSKKFITCFEHSTLEEIVQAMLKNNLDDVYVLGKNVAVSGVFTLTDVSRLIQMGVSFDENVKKYMNRHVVTIHEQATLNEARNLMIEKKIGRLPVVHEDLLIGVIRSDDIRDHFYMRMEEVGQYLTHIIENIHEAVCVINAKGLVQLWNKNAEKLYGVPEADILGHPLKEFFPKAILNQVLEDQIPFVNVYHSPRPNSNIIISAHPLYHHGELIGCVSTDRDITEVEMLSQALKKEREKVSFLESEFTRVSNDGFGKIIGKSLELQKNIDLGKKVAKTEASVFISGESGTGKEVFARAIHEHSEKKGLFVPVNCSAIPSELFESEFFGYEGGAFTGASKQGKVGYFELADGGTLFLDELADLPMHMQAKLLRVLQDGEMRRVGGEKTVKVNVRMISATNKDLKKMVDQELFREDLYFRLNVIEINLPPLKGRENDIDLFVRHFAEEISIKNKMPKPKFSQEVMTYLRSYEWKGNVRELKNVIEHMVILSDEGLIDSMLLPHHIIQFVDQQPQIDFHQSQNLNELLKSVEKKAILHAIEKAQGKKSRAAELLGIPRTSLYYKLKELEIEV